MQSPLYPVNLDLTDKTVVLVGFGPVGQRKLKRLLRCQAKAIRIFDVAKPDSMATPLLTHPAIHFAQRALNESDLADTDLVFICTDNAAENKRVAALCKDRHIFCNCAAEPVLGDMQLPAILSLAELTLTISSKGASPALSRQLGLELEGWILEHYPILRLMQALRPLVLKAYPDREEARSLFRTVLSGPLPQALVNKNQNAIEAILAQILPKALTPHIPDLLAIALLDPPKALHW